LRCFLSYNKADKEVARSIGAHLTLSNIGVWLDEWEIQAGDSIPGKLNDALAAFDAFILLWSEAANRSDWVRQELHSAIMRAINNHSAKIVPCLLDETPLPALIADRCGIDFSDTHEGISLLIGDITGTRTRKSRLMAIQKALDEMDVEWILHPMSNPMVCCPNCGETETLKGWQETDHRRGDTYAGMLCTKCGWSIGGEI
jgi:predicted RNA-binding Zn-ribbon protein involved in translation (DUF1610 family)